MMVKDPVVTVCVTSYNHAPYIRQCIDSVLDQTYRNVDVHVFDDCSTDGTLDILQSFGDKIKLTVYEKNRGVAGVIATVNNAIASATGEFFYRLDSDDFLEADYLERMIREYRSDPKLDWVCGGLNVVGEEGTRVDTWEYTSWPTDPDAALFRAWQFSTVAMPHNGLFRTSFLQKNNLRFENFPCGWGADILFTIRGMQLRPKVKLISGPGFNWRAHGANNSCNVVVQIERILAIKKYYAEHVADEIYIRHPLIKQFRPETADYQAAKFILAADNLYQDKLKFHVPSMFATRSSREETQDNLWRFHDTIRSFVDRSLSHSTRFKKQAGQLLRMVATDEAIIEGRKKLKAGECKEAADRFRQALESNPKSVPALRGLGEACYGRGDIAGAQQYSSEALQLAPNDPDTLNNMGTLLYIQGDHRQAQQTFDRALAGDPELTDAHKNLLVLYSAIAPQTQLDQQQIGAIHRSVDWIAREGGAEARELLLKENHELREEVLRRYTGCYEGSSLRILLHRPGNGALKYLMDSWAETLDLMGVRTALLEWDADTRQTLEEFQPTAFITVDEPAYMERLDRDSISRFRREHGLTIGHITNLQHHFEPCDFFITFHLDPSRDPRFASLDHPVLSLPFGINPQRHYMRPAPEIWDFFFVGTNSRLKGQQTDEFLAPILKKYHGILAGVNWRVGMGEASVGKVAPMYSFAKVCPNYHLRHQYETFDELNERTYIIPACGGFELVDRPLALPEMFAPDEMATAGTAAEFHELFAHFLHHPEERQSYVRKGMRRIWREYTLFHVLTRLIEFLAGDAANNAASPFGNAHAPRTAHRPPQQTARG